MNYLDVPAGDHLAKASKITVHVKNQKPQVEVDFRLTDLNVNMRWYGYFTPGAMPITIKALDLLEWNGDETFAPGSFNTEKEVSLRVAMNTWNGQTKPKVEFVNEVGFTGLGTSDGTELRGLNLKGELAKYRQENGKTAPPANFGAEPSFNVNDEIPF